MSSSYIGKKISISLFGESHSAAVGVVIDRLPAGFVPDRNAIAAFMARRAPGQGAHTTARKEADVPEILSGLVDGHTCGTPLAAMIRNTDARPADYEKLREVPRPSHADFPLWSKTGGMNDIRGGGHASARVTAGLCFAGALCLQLLAERSIRVRARIASIGKIDDVPATPEEILTPDGDRTLPVVSANAEERMLSEIESARKDGDSVGGIVECVADGLPVGLGEPIFDGLENRLAQMVFAIPAVKGIEFGNGFEAARLRGSENNDPFVVENGQIRTATNNHGGILGGMASGMPLVMRVAFKPTPSISRPQQSVNLTTKEPSELTIPGRHDPCVVPRAVPIVEAAAAIVLADLVLAGE